MTTHQGNEAGEPWAAGSDVAVARQCIVDLHGAVVGFELLYRPVVAGAPWPSGEEMTASVVLGALSLGVDQLVGGASIFCNAERAVLVGESAITLPPERTVVEVLETVAIDAEVVEGCRRLVDAGFRIALDDFVWREGAEALLDIAAIVKIDFRAVPADQLPALVARCRDHDVVLLAEKVETETELGLARDLGFELFQGYAVERPQVVRGRTVKPSVLAQAQLATALLTEDFDLERIEEVLRREPGLVVQLLELAAVGTKHGVRRPVRSVREAMVLLGSDTLRRWVALMVLSGQAQPGRPHAVVTALQRARSVELVAGRRGVERPEIAFTAGLLSTLDLLLGVELDQLCEAMHLDERLEEAAFRRRGELGELITAVTRHQSGLPTVAGEDWSSDLDAAAAQSFGWAMRFAPTAAA